MTRKQASDLLLLCIAVEQGEGVEFEILEDTRFKGYSNKMMVIRKQFGVFTHYVQPMAQQKELIAWADKLNAE